MFNTSPSLLLALAEYVIGSAIFPTLLIAFDRTASRLWHWRTDVRFDAAVKAVSASFAMATVAVGAHTFSTCDCDFVLCKRPLVRHWMCFGTAYFVYDILAMMAVFRPKHFSSSSDEAHGKSFLWHFLSQHQLIFIHHVVLAVFG